MKKKAIIDREFASRVNQRVLIDRELASRVNHRVLIDRELASRVNHRELRRFMHVERLKVCHMAIEGVDAGISGVRVRSKPWLS